ncbi:CAMK/DAPK/DAPK protein kinase [Aphelenchoides avenae]|nr:CAMK/DAPK/DAPK protein kinase [Aphelenchus avenae]
MLEYGRATAQPVTYLRRFSKYMSVPGQSFADQIKYRRKWYATVDCHASLSELTNPDEFLLELPHVLKLSDFAQFVPKRAPLFDEEKPTFLKELQNVSTKIGETVQLKCEFTAEEPFFIDWSGPAVELDRCIIETYDGKPTLTIEHVDSACAGQYSVSIDNDVGKAASSCSVSVITPPGTPMDLTVKLLGDSSIHLKWTHTFRGGSEFLWYTVQYRREGFSDWGTVVTGIDGLRHRAIHISKLHPVTYQFRVFASNEFFRGLPSNPVTVNVEERETDAMSSARQRLRFYDIPLLAESFRKIFSVEQVIGKGRFSVVKHATCRMSKRKFAVKCFVIPTSESDFDAIVREIQAMTLVCHPNIVRYFGTTLYMDEILVIMHKVEGVQVLSYLTNLGFISEAIIQKLSSDLINAIDYLHSHELAHLAIKPEDLLVETHNKRPHLVLIDLGSCLPRSAMNELVIWEGGPIEFVAPEVLGHKPCKKSDVWSFGVFLFVIATGISPFEDENEEVVRLKILNLDMVRDSHKYFHRYSHALPELIERLLVVDIRYAPSPMALTILVL